MNGLCLDQQGSINLLATGWQIGATFIDIIALTFQASPPPPPVLLLPLLCIITCWANSVGNVVRCWNSNLFWSMFHIRLMKHYPVVNLLMSSKEQCTQVCENTEMAIFLGTATPIGAANLQHLPASLTGVHHDTRMQSCKCCKYH
jgi:hypothetical protein